LPLPRAAFLDHIIRIVSMVAQMTAIAMTGLTKRICDITFPPMVPQPTVVHPGISRRQPVGLRIRQNITPRTPMAQPANNQAATTMYWSRATRAS
jgi:hypothetical protein